MMIIQMKLSISGGKGVISLAAYYVRVFLYYFFPNFCMYIAS